MSCTCTARKYWGLSPDLSDSRAHVLHYPPTPFQFRSFIFPIIIMNKEEFYGFSMSSLDCTLWIISGFREKTVTPPPPPKSHCELNSPSLRYWHSETQERQGSGVEGPQIPFGNASLGGAGWPASFCHPLTCPLSFRGEERRLTQQTQDLGYS